MKRFLGFVSALAAHWWAERLPALRYSLERSAGWSSAGARAATTMMTTMTTMMMTRMRIRTSNYISGV